MEPEIRPLHKKPKTLGDFMGRPGEQPNAEEIYQYFLEDNDETRQLMEQAEEARLKAEAEFLEQETKNKLALDEPCSN